MINCEIKENTITGLLEVEVKGHAQEYNSIVNSNICATCSLITESLSRELKLFKKYKVLVLESGYFHVIVKLKSDNAVRVGLYETMIVTLASEYQKAFKITHSVNETTFTII